MRVIVTGHKGYIGSVLIPYLVERGHEVLGIDIGLYTNYEFKQKIPKIKEIVKDIRDISSTDLKNYDALIHLAALSNDPLGDFNQDLTKEINYYGSINIAERSKEAGIKRFIFSSSCSVYGISDENKYVNETDLVDPITEYAKSKINFEKYLSKLSNDDFSPIIMRNSTVYGYSPSLRLDLVVQSLTVSSFFTNSINILSDGKPWRPLIHIQDLCNIFCELLIAPKEYIHNQIFNVGYTSENYQILSIAKLVNKLMPSSSITIGKKVDKDSRSYKVDFEKLNKLFHFKNKWNVEMGINEIYEKLKMNMITKDDFERKRYHRLSQLKEYSDKKFFIIKNNRS